MFALITGASSGIGFQYARVMAKRGYDLVIVSNEESIHERAKEIQEEFAVQVIALVRDLGKQEAAKELYDYCHAQDIEIEVLINNAGVYHDCDFLNDSEGFNMLIMNLHMITPAMLQYYFAKDMKARKKGYILNMCSITANIAVQRLGTYGATKAFLQHFTRCTHIEMKDHGVIVTNVSPGAVNTGLYNIRNWLTKMGLAMGYIVSPEYLARRGVRALFRGRAKVTVPSVWNYILLFFVALIPTGLLRLIRKWRIF